MSAIQVTNPYQVFLGLDSAPLDSGYIYVGEENLDPESFPISVYWDSALTIPATQPIRTISGYPSNAGTPAQIFTDQIYSIRVRDVQSNVVFYSVSSEFSGNFLPITGGNMTGAINWAKGSDIASASLTDIGAATGNYVTVTGTTSITSLGTVQAGSFRVVRFSGALTLTHNATSLILLGGANIGTASGDVSGFISEGSGNWRQVFFSRAADKDIIVQNFRLTLSSGNPVDTAGTASSTTVYCSPYTGNRISLYNGVSWVTYSSSEFSLGLGTITSGRPYDVFCYANAGVPTLEFLSWTNDTTRATALTYQDGVLVKTGDATRLYLGTFYTTSTTTTANTSSNRYLWNYYHRRKTYGYCVDTTNSWTYTTATWRQVNANANNLVNCVIGVSEDVISAQCQSIATNSSANVKISSGIGINSTSANSAQILGGEGTSTTETKTTRGIYSGYLSAGKNYIAWLEYSQATGTTTWYGDEGVTTEQAGLLVELFA